MFHNSSTNNQIINFREQIYQQFISPNNSYDIQKWIPSNDISQISITNEQEIDKILNIQLSKYTQQIDKQNQNEEFQDFQKSSQKFSSFQEISNNTDILPIENNQIIEQDMQNIQNNQTHFQQNNDYYQQLIQKYQEPPNQKIFEESYESKSQFDKPFISKETMKFSDIYDVTQSTKSQINQTPVNNNNAEIEEENENKKLLNQYNTNQCWMKLKIRKEAKQYEIYKQQDFQDLFQSLPGLYIHKNEGQLLVDKIRKVENQENLYYQQFELLINAQQIIGPIKFKKHLKIHIRFKSNYSGVVFYDKQLNDQIPINQTNGITLKNQPLILTNISDYQVKLICCVVNIKLIK